MYIVLCTCECNTVFSLHVLPFLYRDGDEWVRLFASVLAPFPDNQTITLEADSNATEVLEEIGEACE